jgi:hypothetical protein
MTVAQLGEFLRQLRASVIADLTTAGHDEGEAAALADLQMTATFPNDRPPPERTEWLVRQRRKDARLPFNDARLRWRRLLTATHIPTWSAELATGCSERTVRGCPINADR